MVRHNLILNTIMEMITCGYSPNMCRYYVFYILIIFFSEFRECFYLFAREGVINKLDELSVIMRSLGMSPTITELKKYFSENSKCK